jgi:HSP20 family protein
MIRSAEGGSLPSGWKPNVDVYETSEDLVVAIDLAGVAPETIDISVTGRRLLVSGSRHPLVRPGARRIHNLEIPYGPFELAVNLPCPVDSASSAANWKDGLLEVVLPIPSPVRPQITPRERTGRQRV